ncbi:MAG: PIG-L deacetylase family protein [Ardenticatenaceae bacterium]
MVLSPHFDDGVLSCGGRIWQAVQEGQAVRVLSLFAGGPVGDVPPFAAVQHAMWGNPPDPNRLRRAEDVAAYTRLGCFDLHHLDAPDAVYRVSEDGRPLYGAEEAIFGDIEPEEHDYARSLVDDLLPYLLDEATILAPLGVGHHVDHLLGYAVGRLLLENGWPVAFYEELPYIESKGALEEVLADKPSWRAERISLSEAALAAKVDAMGYYRSQIPVLYGNDLAMSRRIRAVANAVADGIGYAERIWWPDL